MDLSNVPVSRRRLITLCGSAVAAGAVLGVSGALRPNVALAAHQVPRDLFEDSTLYVANGVRGHLMDGRIAYCLWAPGPAYDYYDAMPRSVTSVENVGGIPDTVAIGYVFYHGYSDDNPNCTYNGVTFTWQESIAITQICIWYFGWAHWRATVVDARMKAAVDWLIDRALEYQSSHPCTESEPMVQGLVKYVAAGGDYSPPPQDMIGYGVPRFGSLRIEKKIVNYHDYHADLKFKVRVHLHEEYMPKHASAELQTPPLVGNFGGNVFDSGGNCEVFVTPS